MTAKSIELDWEQIFDKYEDWSDRQAPPAHSMNVLEQRAIKRIVNAAIKKAAAPAKAARPAAKRQARPKLVPVPTGDGHPSFSASV